MNIHANLFEILFSTGLLLLLLVSHYLCSYLKRIPGVSPEKIISFAGGVAVAYVFLHMLPDLVETRDKIHDLLSMVTVMTPFKDFGVFIIALIGFEVFYLLERFTSEADLDSQQTERRHYWLNLWMYFIYNFTITYTMIIRIRTGPMYAVLFALAMALHFVLTDNRFKRYFPNFFDARSHIYLLTALLLGYVGAIIFPANVYAFAILTAFLSGAVLYNSFAEEIALDRQTSMTSFFLGTGVMASFLLLLLIK